MSEDPAMDGLNWYAYCGSNPIAYVDWSGKYYVVANREPSSVETNFRYGDYTGTYSLVKDHQLSPLVDGVTSYIPLFGGAVSDFITSPGGGDIIGGTSLNESYADDAAKDWGKAYLLQNPLEPITGKGVWHLFDGVGALYNIAKRSDVVDYDRTLFGLMELKGLKSEFNSAQELEIHLSRLNGIIANNSSIFKGPISFAESQFLCDYALYSMSQVRRENMLMKQAGIPMYARHDLDCYGTQFSAEIAAYNSLLNDYNSRIDDYKNMN
jgi:hypothetical protein